MSGPRDLNVNSQKGDLILDICKELGATGYLSGGSGKGYLDPIKFAQNSVDLIFQEFHHPVYRQLHSPFIPCMSAIDLMFNWGPASLDVLRGVGVETMDQIFS